MDRSCTQTRTALAAVLLATTLAHADANAVKATLQDPYFNKVQAGVHVVLLGKTPEDDKVVFDRDAATPRVPASNLKLVTTAAAIETLGADFHFRTVIARKDDTLALVGDGDPTLGDAKLMKELGLSTNAVVEQWAAALQQRGIRSAGKLLFDDSVFDEQRVHPNWPDNQLHRWYCAEVSGLTYNIGCLDFYLKPNGRGQVVGYQTDPPTRAVTVENTCVLGTRNAVALTRAANDATVQLSGQTDGANSEPISVTVHDPATLAANVTKEILVSAGISVGEVVRDRTIRDSLKDWQLLVVHETPLSHALLRANRDSVNLYAEALAKRMGHKLAGQSGTFASGAQAIGKYLESIGVPKEQFSLDDGSGLSRENRISPSAVTKVLASQFHGKNRDLFLSSLAVGGAKEGTLKKRFDDTPQRLRVFAKSGSINGVSSLSGYLKARDGNWYAFSILINDVALGTAWQAQQFQERIVGAIDQ